METFTIIQSKRDFRKEEIKHIDLQRETRIPFSPLHIKIAIITFKICFLGVSALEISNNKERIAHNNNFLLKFSQLIEVQ